MPHGSYVRHQLRRAAVRSATYGPIKRGLDAAWLRRRRRSATYSQFGEDLAVVDRLGPSGAYLDIGANHPFKASNTYLLYVLGWSGLTIEPIRSLYEQHRAIRPRDTCLNAAAGAAPARAVFHELNPSGFSTFDAVAADELCSTRRAVPVASYEVRVERASDTWFERFPDRPVDFVSIDTEGFEPEVIAGIDFERLQPRLVLVEFEAGTGGPRGDSLTNVMMDRGYRLDATFGVNGLFVRSDS